MKKQKKMHQRLKLNMAKEENYPVIKTKVILFGKNCIKLAPLTASNFWQLRSGSLFSHQALIELGCVTKRTLVKDPKPSLFSGSVPASRGSTVSLEEPDAVFYEPTISCCLQLCRVLPNERHWNDNLLWSCWASSARTAQEDCQDYIFKFALLSWVRSCKT